MYGKLRIAKRSDLDKLLKGADSPVILVEGTRSVPPEDEELIAEMGRMLAKRYPNAEFRTGNATGTDTLFADAIAEVDASRIQYVMPHEGMGRARRHEGAAAANFQQLSKVAQTALGKLTCDASTKIERLVDASLGKVANKRLAAKGNYLLRDTMKVVGAPEVGLGPATVGIFYVKDADPLSGGTGHTIRVCMKERVPVVLQETWREWLQ